ncbi:MAG: YppG family protein [Bacilli bacterium]
MLRRTAHQSYGSPLMQPYSFAVGGMSSQGTPGVQHVNNLTLGSTQPPVGYVQQHMVSQNTQTVVPLQETAQTMPGWALGTPSVGTSTTMNPIWNMNPMTSQQTQASAPAQMQGAYAQTVQPSVGVVGEGMGSYMPSPAPTVPPSAQLFSQMYGSPHAQPVHPYPLGMKKRPPVEPSNGMNVFLKQFKNKEGAYDMNKVLNTTGQMVSTVNQIGGIVKQVGGLFKFT